MDLKNTIQNHPIVMIATTAVGAGMVVFGVVNYLCTAEKIRIKQLHENKLIEAQIQYKEDINKLNHRVSGIERRLAGEQFLDIIKLVSIHPPEKIDQSIKGLKYHRQMSFWALHDEEKWDTKYIGEMEHIKQTLGINLSNIFGSDIVNKLNGVHAWRWIGKKEIKFQYKEEKNIFLKERPFILVQKFGRTDNFNYIRILNTSLTRQSLRSGQYALDKITELVNTLSTTKNVHSKAPLISTGIYNQNDHPSTLLFLIMRQLYNSVLWGRNSSVIIRSMQKSGPVIYAQVIIKENSLKFDNSDEGHLWIVREFILFPFRDDFMMISTYIPTTTPAFNDGYFSDVNAWLLSFYLAEF